MISIKVFYYNVLVPVFDSRCALYDVELLSVFRLVTIKRLFLSAMTDCYTHLYKSTLDGCPYYKSIVFRNYDDCCMFIEEMDEIKKIRDQIDDDGGINGLPEDVFLHRVTAWKLTAHYWLTIWGRERVPADMRRVINDVEDILEMPLTDFGRDIGRLNDPGKVDS